MDTNKFACFVAERRKELNMTQKELAAKIHVTDKAVSRWERGKSIPDVSIMLELCDELEISVNELLCGRHLDTEEEKIENANNILKVPLLKKKYKTFKLHLRC